MKHLLFSLILLLNCKCFSQIDLQSGSAVYSIPLFSHSDAKSGLSADLTLAYSSNQGLKLNELASNLGLGWSLLAGGEIDRITNGEPDDQYDPQTDIVNMSDAVASDNIYQVNNTLYNDYFPNGFLYKKFPTNYVPKPLAYMPRFDPGSLNKYMMAPEAGEDNEQDYFLFNVGGITKKFAIGKNFRVIFEDQNLLNVPTMKSLLNVQVNKEDVNVNTLYQQNIITKITGFVVTDENGIIYTFDKYDKDQVMETVRSPLTCYTTGGNNTCNINDQNEQSATNKYVINRWLLTSIKDPISNRTINFVYDTENWKYVTQISSVSNTSTDINNNSYSSTSLNIGSRFCSYSILKQIIYPDNTLVQINYSTANRADLDGSKAISSIDIKSNSSIYKTWIFDMSYFNGKNIVSGAGIVQSYDALFSYSNLGYRYIDINKIMNAYSYRLALQDIRETVPSSTQSKTYNFSYYTGSESADALDKVPSRFEKIGTDQFSLLREDFSGHYYKNFSSIGDNGRSYGDGSAQMGLLKEVDEPSKKSIIYNYNIIPTFPFKNAVVVNTIENRDLLNQQSILNQYSYAGLICEYSGMSDQLGYSYPNLTFETRDGDGSLDAPRTSKSARFLNSLIQQEIYKLFPTTQLLDLFELIDNGGVSNWIYTLFGKHQSTYGLNESSVLDLPVSELNPLPSNFAVVSEYDVIAGTSYLSKQYSFNKNTSVVKGNIFPYPGQQRFNPGGVGNLVSVKYFKREDQNNPVYQKILNYDYSNSLLDDNFLSVKSGAIKYISDRYDVPSTIIYSAILDSWISTVQYHFMTGKASLNSQTETLTGTSASETTSTITNFIYDSKNNLPKQTSSVASNGTLKGSNIYYSADYWDLYTSNNVLQSQKQNNMWQVPYATIDWYKTSSSATTYNVTGISLMQYDPVTLKLFSTKVSRIKTPVNITQSQLDNFDPFSSSFLTGIQFDEAQDNYYVDNLLVEQMSGNQTTTVSYKYDYNTFLPEATITNSVFAFCSYTSFENPNKDYWQYSDAAVQSDATAITGDYSYHLTGNTISSNTILNNALSSYHLNFFVTLWLKTGGSVTVNGTSGTTLATINSWQLLRFSLNSPTSVSVAGSGDIDELRFYKTDAQMSTTSYKPMVGISSICDENNKLTYYEYDKWDRLSIVRDQNKNILKKYCYNIDGIAGNCNEALVGNQSMSGIYYRSDCGSANTGSAVTYVIPANTYFAYNQAAADAAARNALLNNGCAYANAHGACTAGNCSNCTGEGYKCVNGQCTPGTKIYSSSIDKGSYWLNTYHYYWPGDCTGGDTNYTSQTSTQQQPSTNPNCTSCLGQ